MPQECSRGIGLFFFRGTDSKPKAAQYVSLEMAAQPKAVAVIVGCGSKHDKDGAGTHLPPTSRYGLGGALSIRFATEGGYHVVLMGRRSAILQEIANEVTRAGGTASTVVCDVANDESVATAFGTARSFGTIEVLVFNASAPLPPGTTFMTLPKPKDVEPDYLNFAINISVTGALRCVKQVLDGMIANKKGAVLLSGATMSLRGGPTFAALSPAKFALRSLGQSLYQEYAPQGVHVRTPHPNANRIALTQVAHVIIDGVIESPNTEPWGLAAGGKVQLQDPKDIADAYIALVRQPPSCWTHELQISPQLGGIGMRL